MLSSLLYWVWIALKSLMCSHPYIADTISREPSLNQALTCTHWRTGAKKLVGQKEICPTFFHFARLYMKQFFRVKFPKCLLDGGEGVFGKFSLTYFFHFRPTSFPGPFCEKGPGNEVDFRLLSYI
jgi:hypothetical protein